MTDEDRLDDAKRRYLDAKEEMEALRMKIGRAACPLNVGDEVNVQENSKIYKGLIEYTGYLLDDSEHLNPVVGSSLGWSAGGHRIKKTTDELGTWGFGLNSRDAELVNGVWIMKKRSLNEVMGIV